MINNELYAEQAVIGCLLIDNHTWDEVGDYLRPDDFVLRLHGDIFSAVRDLLSNGKKADMICVSEYLAVKNGDDPFVQVCEIAQQSAYAPQNIKSYAEIVKHKSLDRKMVFAAQKIISSVKEQKENRLDNAEQLIAEIAEEKTSDIYSVADILPSVMSAIDDRQTSQSDMTGLSTGFSDLDRLTHGLRGGNLIILAGRPSMGKTLLGMNIAEHVAINQNKPVAVFSLEMSKEELIERSLASIAKIEADQIRSGKLSEPNYQKIFSTLPRLQGTKLFIDDRSCSSVSDIRAKCRRIKREHGLAMVLIDYITLMASEGENETIRIANISRGLKLLARDLNVPVIAISQLNRNLEHRQRQDKRPYMADLRQSGAIEQDADLILFIYRDEVYDEDSPNKGIAEIIVAKQRNGRLGTINLAFNSQYCRFDNYNGVYTASYQPKTNWGGQAYEY